MRLLVLSAAVLLLSHPISAQVWEKIPGAGNGSYSFGTNAQNNNAVWIGGFSQIYRSFDKGGSVADTVQIPFQTGIITTIFIHPVDTAFILVGSINGCHISRDGGETWSHALPDTSVGLIGDSIALEPGTSDTLYVALLFNRQNSTTTFFRSTDRGVSWVSLPAALGEGTHSYCTLVALGENKLLGGRQFSTGIYRSTNGGGSWSQSYVHSDSLIEVPAMVRDKTRPNSVWAAILNTSGENGYVVYSASNGTQWTKLAINGNPWGLDTDLKGIVYVGLFGGGAPGALFSQTLGASWVHNSSGFPTGSKANIWMLKTSNDGSVLYLADQTLGPYRWVLGGGTTSVASHENEDVFTLAQNYPNPFNPSTTIRFSLTSERFVNLKIYNMLGQEVAVLLNNVLPAGAHNVPFNAIDLPGGIYLYRLRAGDFVQSGRMVLLK